MRNSWIYLAIALCGVLALTAIRVGAQSVQPSSETYTWSGELVSFDPAAHVLLVKSRVVGNQALTELPRFKAGDRIVLTWSGFDTYADAISRAVRYDAAKKWNEPFAFPVEFVAYEAPREYLTFKVKVPAGSVEAIKAVKPGEWVTVTSRHRAPSEGEAIASVNAYGASASRTTTN